MLSGNRDVFERNLIRRLKEVRSRGTDASVNRAGLSIMSQFDFMVEYPEKQLRLDKR